MTTRLDRLVASDPSFRRLSAFMQRSDPNNFFTRAVATLTGGSSDAAMTGFILRLLAMLDGASQGQTPAVRTLYAMLADDDRYDPVGTTDSVLEKLVLVLPPPGVKIRETAGAQTKFLETAARGPNDNLYAAVRNAATSHSQAALATHTRALAAQPQSPLRDYWIRLFGEAFTWRTSAQQLINGRPAAMPSSAGGQVTGDMRFASNELAGRYLSQVEVTTPSDVGNTSIDPRVTQVENLNPGAAPVNAPPNAARQFGTPRPPAALRPGAPAGGAAPPPPNDVFTGAPFNPDVDTTPANAGAGSVDRIRLMKLKQMIERMSTILGINEEKVIWFLRLLVAVLKGAEGSPAGGPIIFTQQGLQTLYLIDALNGRGPSMSSVPSPSTDGSNLIFPTNPASDPAFGELEG